MTRDTTRITEAQLQALKIENTALKQTIKQLESQSESMKVCTSEGRPTGEKEQRATGLNRGMHGKRTPPSAPFGSGNSDRIKERLGVVCVCTCLYLYALYARHI